MCGFFSGAESRACWAIFLEQKAGRAGRFFSGAENRRVVGVFFFGAKKICSGKAVIRAIQ